ncbi:hypothetical protein NCS57_00249700 [Fusarium keratoplasticum]|uniref:Uncharacterized protein n=1 Tax=Fusarium keratoplasticum TaxID=1328300 RepID=A0ACC0R8G9_9HYPO|nr:hypothetical protein NCS57_00249700 [Fusarium keratoplasticum]KAI8679712.1 hypothetical protein NCS57_00249700 [Fusarium keratoplasticum]
MSSDETSENTPASPREEDQINELYWPVLRKILEKDPSGMDRLNLECMICNLPMSIKADKNGENKNGFGHRALILPCGHLVGTSCMHEFNVYRLQNGLHFTCPLHCEPLHHPECGCFLFCWHMPDKVEDFDGKPFCRAEGMPVTPKCGSCTLKDVGRCLTTLTSIFEPKFFGELISFQVVYQVQVLDFIWGRLAGDERKCVAIDIPDSMHDLCRSIEAKLVALCNLPGQTVKDGDVKIRLFRYSGPLAMDRRLSM